MKTPETADSRLVVLGTEPWNAETALHRHLGVITPNASFYKRNHFPIPQLTTATWSLPVSGEVDRPVVWTYDDLLALPHRTVRVTLECAGNGRAAMDPPALGEQWKLGAVSTAEWTGVRLREVLERSGLTSSAREIVFEGADGGEVPDAGGRISFARSLPREVALHDDVLLALGMNGETLPQEHGFPVRLVVPGWYGVASVKWLVSIRAIDTPFDGFYQTDRYILALPGTENTPEPLTRMAPRSIFTWPTSGTAVTRGYHHLRGLAWSGHAAAHQIEVSTDDGATWTAGSWTSPAEPYAWRLWEAPWSATSPGPATLLCRTRDARGNAQPEAAPWNRLGYVNNAIQRITVTVE